MLFLQQVNVYNIRQHKQTRLTNIWFADKRSTYCKTKSSNTIKLKQLNNPTLSVTSWIEFDRGKPTLFIGFIAAVRNASNSHFILCAFSRLHKCIGQLEGFNTKSSTETQRTLTHKHTWREKRPYQYTQKTGLTLSEDRRKNQRGISDIWPTLQESQTKRRPYWS